MAQLATRRPPRQARLGGRVHLRKEAREPFLEPHAARGARARGRCALAPCRALPLASRVARLRRHRPILLHIDVVGHLPPSPLETTKLWCGRCTARKTRVAAAQERAPWSGKAGEERGKGSRRRGKATSDDKSSLTMAPSVRLFCPPASSPGRAWPSGSAPCPAVHTPGLKRSVLRTWSAPPWSCPPSMLGRPARTAWRVPPPSATPDSSTLPC